MNEWTDIVMDVGWIHPLAKTQFFSCQQLVMKIAMGGWNLDEKSFGKWQFLQYYKSIIPQEIHEEWQMILG